MLKRQAENILWTHPLVNIQKRFEARLQLYVHTFFNKVRQVDSFENGNSFNWLEIYGLILIFTIATSNIYCQRCYPTTNYGRPVRKLSSLHSRKSNPNPKLLCTAEAYFVCHIGPKFQSSLTYASIGCP